MRQRQTFNFKTGRLHLGYLLAGIALLMVSTSSRADKQLWIQDPYTSDSVLTSVRDPDTSLWNAARIDDYEASLKVESAPPLGILTIEKLNIQVPIYNGTDDVTLDRGAGRIKGMARMDEEANLGISGHRDGFFRTLKDIEVGDDIEIQTTRGVEKYAVTAINIVPKADVSVLDPKTDKTLTLVTCYPFYFVGHAPKRYIVTAVPKSPGYD
jgi:sortase A